MSEPAVGKARRPVVAGRGLFLFFTLAAGGCAVDLVTKSWIFAQLGYFRVEQGTPHPPIWLINENFGFETSLNEGALFGFGQGWVVAFAVLSVLAAVAIVAWILLARAWRDRHLITALGLVMAGILGNLYDRVGLHGLTWAGGIDNHLQGSRVYAVRDWLHFKIELIDWPIFNLADSFLVCGAILLVWHAVRHHD